VRSDGLYTSCRRPCRERDGVRFEVNDHLTGHVVRRAEITVHNPSILSYVVHGLGAEALELRLGEVVLGIGLMRDKEKR
jgi:hypothetical protein